MTARYCQPGDVRTILQGLGVIPNPGSGTAAELTDAQIMEAITEASSVVTGYVGTNYEADQWNPNPVVPPMVRTLSVRLAAYYSTLIYRKGKDLTPTDPVYLMYQDVRSVFADIVTGKIEVNPGRPNEAPEHQGQVRQTVPKIFVPSDSGTKIRSGQVDPAGSAAWGGYSPSPWTGYDQGQGGY